MLDALPLANEARSGDRLLTGTDAAHDRVAAIDLATQRLEALDRLRLQSAIGQFLDPVGETAFEEAPVVGRRLAVEQITPLPLQVWRRRGLQGRQSGKNGVAHSAAPTFGFGAT